MHPAGVFHENDRARLEAAVADAGLAVIVACQGGRPLAAHAPVLLAGERLRFHLSAANPLCAPLVANGAALAIVTGPHAYVSPDWYGAPDQVPTWNYISAEIEGPVRRMDRDQTIALLDDLAARFEAPLRPKPPWSRAKMTPSRFDQLLGAIIGFEMQVARCEGVRKLSQNKPADQVRRAAAHLGALPGAGAQAMAALMAAPELDS